LGKTLARWQKAKRKLVLFLIYYKMSEACETCSGCGTGLVIFLCVLWVIFIYIAIEAYSGWALSEWIWEWMESWIEKLPRPKNRD